MDLQEYRTQKAYKDAEEEVRWQLEQQLQREEAKTDENTQKNSD